MMKKQLSLFTILPALIVLLFSCNENNADLIITNAKIYTVDGDFTIAEAMAIKDGKILAVGSTADITAQYKSTETEDAAGKFIYPGFIDAHSHFFGLASDMRQANLFGTATWSECLSRLQEFVKTKRIEKGEWIIGNGWDQNNWPEKNFPDRDSLDFYFPDNPVLLSRVDGHAAIVNKAALEAASVTAPVQMTGGEMIVKNGRLTGVLIDNAIDVVSAVIPADSEEDVNASLLEAQRKLFSQGLTTISDCGLGFKSVNKIQQMQDAGSLKLRFYVMLSDNKANYDFIAENGKIKTDRLNVRSFKIFGDGALGSRGACLLAPYSDQKGYYGFLLSSPEHFDSVANFLYTHDLQMNTHAIGDSGNRTLLNIYGKYLQGENDRRWRIEHAQVIAPSDFELFGKYKIIPSVQPTHATSDMKWAVERLGDERIKTAYAYNQLLNENGWLALGTDFPVEDTDPLKTFYAAVIRKDIYSWPENGFQTDNALTREETLRGMTIWAAKANFEENEKGSLEAGKMADFVILEQDLMTAEENEILSIKVLSTFVNGERVFKQ